MPASEGLEDRKVTDSESAKLITMLVTAFPDDWRFLSDEQQETTRALYRRMLRDLDYPRADAAVTRLVATAKKMPKISEIRITTMRLSRGREHKGLEAWGDIQKKLRKYGRDKVPGKAFVIDDPIAARVVDVMGWRYLATAEKESHVSDRSRFSELYDELAAEQVEDLAVGAIAAPIPQRRLGAGPTSISGIVNSSMKKLEGK